LFQQAYKVEFVLGRHTLYMKPAQTEEETKEKSKTDPEEEVLHKN
jgi:hypothetical protein